MEYERKGKYEKAASLHQQVFQQWPDNARAERARFGFSKTAVLSLIQSGDYTTAEAELDKFTADFGQNPDFTRAMFVVGEQYYHQGCVKDGQNEMEQAEQLYQKAIAVLNRVRQQSQSYEFTPGAWYLTGRCYRGLGDYEKVIECCGKVAVDWPGCRNASDAQFLVGRSYEKLAEAGVMSKSEAEPEIKVAYQRLLEKYPDCEAARHARRWLSRHN
jgi:TolA-binding protein